MENSDEKIFGNRFLTNEEDLFTHNAWDEVEWNSDLELEAKEKVKQNSELKCDEEKIENYEKNSNEFWNEFYNIHQNKFFKDRHWLFMEFPELAQDNLDLPERVYKHESSTKIEFVPEKIFEIGCGVGNTVFPILKYNTNPKLKVYASDFSLNAIEILKNSEEYDINRCKAFILDATNDEWQNLPFKEDSLDIIILIFCLSAINPEKYETVLKNCYKYLKPGGLVLFRDYGRYDLAQLRFKKGHCLKDNFYARGDGTRVYFFDQNELKILFEKFGYYQLQNFIDRRLQVNRGKKLKMYRVWIQAKFQKPLDL